jgi:hypothetical protein
MTFFVTPGAVSGLHLLFSYVISYLPDYSCGHRLSHIVIKSVTAFACENVENLYGAIAFTSRNVLIVPIKANTKCWRRNITKRVLMCNLDFTVLCWHNLKVRRAWWQIFFLSLLISHHCHHFYV